MTYANAPEDKLKDTIYRINRDAARFFAENLFSNDGKEALDYLTERGLSRDTIEALQLGVAPDDEWSLFAFLSHKGYDVSDMIESFLIREDEKIGYCDTFAGRIIFPVFDRDGNVIAFIGRDYSDEKNGRKKIKPVYINCPDTPVYIKGENLYGMEHAWNNSKQLLIVEGPMDVAALYNNKVTNAVAVLGATLTDKQAALISRCAEEAVVIFDSDGAGQKGAERAAEKIKQCGADVFIATLPECKDPDEYIRKNGIAKFMDEVNNQTIK